MFQLYNARAKRLRKICEVAGLITSVLALLARQAVWDITHLVSNFENHHVSTLSLALMQNLKDLIQHHQLNADDLLSINLRFFQ